VRAKAGNPAAQAQAKGKANFWGKNRRQPQQFGCATLEQVYSFAAHIRHLLRNRG
jgi:hypothetical protein